ncbi:hypothetical protein [Pantoea sp.]|nr:hypothetical protein [Pantoea sp.]
MMALLWQWLRQPSSARSKTIFPYLKGYQRIQSAKQRHDFVVIQP